MYLDTLVVLYVVISATGDIAETDTKITRNMSSTECAETVRNIHGTIIPHDEIGYDTQIFAGCVEQYESD